MVELDGNIVDIKKKKTELEMSQGTVKVSSFHDAMESGDTRLFPSRGTRAIHFFELYHSIAFVIVKPW